MRLFAHFSADITIAVRHFAKAPAWCAAAAGTLALGLAASLVTGVLVRDVLLAPLAFPRSDRLVRLVEVSENGRRWWPSFPNAADWREHARMFAGVGIADIPRLVPVLLDGTASRVPVSRAARGLFETLGVTPLSGRFFTADEQQPGGPAAAIVSERFWRRELGGAPPGTSVLTIGLERFPVVGVLPGRFRFLGDGAAWTEAADVWTAMDRDRDLGGRTSHGYHVVARLADGMTLDRAAADLNRLARVLREQHREPTQADTVLMTPLQDVVVRRARDPLRLLLYAAGGVLIVTCLNLAAAILARGLARSRELSVRLALGASRWALVRLLVVEAQALAVPGAVAGIALAGLAFGALRANAAAALPRLDEARLDPTAAAFACLLGIAVATAAGLIPAIVLSRQGLVDRLRTHGATSGPREHRRLWTAFVVVQGMLTVLLLTGTGLLVRSFDRALRVDLGYDAQRVLAADITLPDGRYQSGERRIAYYDEVLQQLRATPGIVAAGLTSSLPHVTSEFTSGTYREGHDAQSVFAGYRLVDPGYFEALGIGRVRGAASDGAGNAVVDARLASQLWDGGDALGDRVVNGFAREPLRISAVVRTVREWNQGEETIGAVYQDYRERSDRLTSMHVVARYRGDETAAVAAVRGVLARVDPMVPATVSPLAALASSSLGDRRLFVLLGGGFGAIALLLSAAGVHALVAFVVARQRREAAIRLALGAAPAAVLRRTLLRGLAPAAIGVAGGLLLAMPLGAAMQSQLFQVAPWDPVAIGGAGLAVVAAAALAVAGPARRAARTEPAVALRQE